MGSTAGLGSARGILSAAALVASGCLSGPSAGTPGPAAPTVAPGHTVAVRMGSKWDDADDRFEIYDPRRWLWLDIRDGAGNPLTKAPKVAIAPPAGLLEPQVFPLQAGPEGRFFARVRFYDPGAGYELGLAIPAGEATRTVTVPLPEVLPARRRVGSLQLDYQVSPSRGKALKPATISLKTDPAAATAPRVKIVNPCGWGPEGTFSAAADAPGAFTWEIPATEVIEVTGNYRVKIYPLTDPATYAEFTFETR